MTNGNGWTGKDPYLRRLRSLAVAVILALLGYTVVSAPESATVTIGTLVGALLVVLGFEVGLRWPDRPGKKGDEE